jgi:hypothetical protein
LIEGNKSRPTVGGKRIVDVVVLGSDTVAQEFLDIIGSKIAIEANSLSLSILFFSE